MLLCYFHAKVLFVDKVINKWQPRLRSYVCDSGQHFQQLLNWNVAFFAEISHFLWL